MSVKHRVLFIFPAVIAASWIAVRSLAASPTPALEDPPLALATGSDIPDPALAQLITQFAADARSSR
ncbi:MAG TPA: hypothetical protein VHM31_15890 [Polyangia bacterium]|nr:hypothetical protein [Polyangia bacterium]